MQEKASAADKSGTVQAKIQNNGLEAVIIITPPEGEGKSPTIDMVRNELEKLGVVQGIDEEVLGNVIKEGIYNQEIVVARGTPAVDGKDSVIRYFFETSRNAEPKEDEKGNVDYKDINLLQNVVKGDKLAELIPPQPGTEGVTVTGKKILPKIGKIIKLPAGKNTEPSPDNPNILIASSDGNVYLDKGSYVQVDPVFVVASDVDYNTGNIDYVGALVIKGDVKSGFKAAAQSDLEIQGLVEDATVVAGSNVLIKKGFLGRGNGIIRAEGNVFLKFCENQKIIAKGNIVIGEIALNSTLKSDGIIDVTGTKKGAVVGGSVAAKKGVVVRELGNYQEVKTEVSVGIDEELIGEIDEIEAALKKNADNMEHIKKAVFVLVKKKMAGGLTSDQSKLLSQLQRLQSELPTQCLELEDRKKKTQEKLDQYKDVTIQVESRVYPGVRITMLQHKKVIQEEMPGGTFKIVDEKIEYLT